MLGLESCKILCLYRQLDYMYEQMTIDIEKNADLGILSGLDTSALSQLVLKKYDSQIRSVVVCSLFYTVSIVLIRSSFFFLHFMHMS